MTHNYSVKWAMIASGAAFALQNNKSDKRDKQNRSEVPDLHDQKGHDSLYSLVCLDCFSA